MTNSLPILSPSVIESGKELSLLLDRVVQVTSEAQQNMAAQIGNQVDSHLKSVEELRKKLVAPHLERQREINRVASDHSDPLETKLKRVKRLLGDFQEKELARVEAIKQAQKVEFDRLEAERQKAVVESQTAATLGAQIAAEQRANELLEVSREVLLQPAYALRAGGMRVRSNEVDFEITDLNAAVRARPDLFKIEPRKQLIKDLPLDAKVPGIRLFVKPVEVGFVR